MKKTINNPTFKLEGTPLPSIEIDMWEIQGEYSDGLWHRLIHSYANQWISENNFKGKATFWSVVLPSVNFHHQGNSFFLVGCYVPDELLNGLKEFLSQKFQKQVRMSDEIIATRKEGWRPYLHLEQEKVWEYCEDFVWVEVT